MICKFKIHFPQSEENIHQLNTAEASDAECGNDAQIGQLQRLEFFVDAEM